MAQNKAYEEDRIGQNGNAKLGINLGSVATIISSHII